MAMSSVRAIRWGAKAVLVAAVSGFALSACSIEAIVTPAGQADIDWQNMSVGEQTLFCEVYNDDATWQRDILFQGLREERGWTNETSLYQYWGAITRYCRTESPVSPRPAPSRASSEPTSSFEESAEPDLGASGYPVQDEDAYLKAARAHPLLGSQARDSADQDLFYIAVPICVGVREEGMSRSELAGVLKKTDLDPRYIEALIEVSLDNLCPG
jgi:hypothetical protein